MSISFAKHRKEIEAAWKDVLDDKSTTNWSLYGYEGQTNELKVMGSGEGGLEELSEELHSCKIMYAFLRFEEQKTGLKKFLLINWQGEGAPVLRKGTCANHIHDVTKILSGAHLTINARNEDDLDEERLLKKLMTTNSSFNLKEPRIMIEEQKTPVGTNYRRVIPTKELNATIMQDFWKREEEEEKRRLAYEKEQKRLQQEQLEKEQRAREEKEHMEREKKLQQQQQYTNNFNNNNNKLQSAHVPIKTFPQPLSPEKTLAGDFQNSALTEAERMRQQRSQEVRELIGSRILAAKAIFTKHTSEGQLQSKLNSAPPAKPARNSITQRINAFNQTTEQKVDQATGIAAAPATAAATVTGVNKNIKMQISREGNAALNFCKSETILSTNPGQCSVAIGNHFDNLEQPVKPAAITTAVSNNDDETNNLDDYPLEPDAEQFSTIKRSPHSKTNSLQSPDESAISTKTKITASTTYNASTKNNTQNDLYQNKQLKDMQYNDADENDEADEQNDNDENEEEEKVMRTKVSVTVQQSQSQVHTQQTGAITMPSPINKNGYNTSNSLNRGEIDDIINEDDFICQDSLGDLGLRARALYDYQAADESEITFDPGDIITHIDQIDEGWWQGLGPDGTYGLFPANYVEIINI